MNTTSAKHHKYVPSASLLQKRKHRADSKALQPVRRADIDLTKHWTTDFRVGVSVAYNSLAFHFALVISVGSDYLQFDTSDTRFVRIHIHKSSYVGLIPKDHPSLWSRGLSCIDPPELRGFVDVEPVVDLEDILPLDLVTLVATYIPEVPIRRGQLLTIGKQELRFNNRLSHFQPEGYSDKGGIFLTGPRKFDHVRISIGGFPDRWTSVCRYSDHRTGWCTPFYYDDAERIRALEVNTPRRTIYKLEHFRVCRQCMNPSNMQWIPCGHTNWCHQCCFIKGIPSQCGCGVAILDAISFLEVVLGK